MARRRRQAHVACPGPALTQRIRRCVHERVGVASCMTSAVSGPAASMDCGSFRVSASLRPRPASPCARSTASTSCGDAFTARARRHEHRHRARRPARSRSMSRRSRAVRSAAGRSPLVTTRMSAISRMPGLDRLHVVAQSRRHTTSTCRRASRSRRPIVRRRRSRRSRGRSRPRRARRRRPWLATGRRDGRARRASG